MAAHRKPYQAPGSRGPVNEPGLTGRDPHGRFNEGRGSGANRNRPPQYSGPGSVTESPLDSDDPDNHGWRRP